MDNGKLTAMLRKARTLMEEAEKMLNEEKARVGNTDANRASSLDYAAMNAADVCGRIDHIMGVANE